MADKYTKISIIETPRKVGIITEKEAGLLTGESYDKYGSLFCPVQDVNDNWVISQIEIESNVNERFKWVNSLPLVEYKPKPEMPWW